MSDAHDEPNGTSTLSPPTPHALSCRTNSQEKLSTTDLNDRLSPTVVGVRNGNRVPSLASSSRRNSTTSVGEEEDDSASLLRVSGGSGTNHRAALAQKAMENAEQEAREEQERAERRKKEDEAAYERVRNAGLIEGLQLSDESDEEEEIMTGGYPSANGSSLSREVSKEEENRLSPHKTISRTSSNASNRGRDRANTQPSIYAESTYSQSSLAPPLPGSPSVPPLPGSTVTAADVLLGSTSHDLSPVQTREEPATTSTTQDFAEPPRSVSPSPPLPPLPPASEPAESLREAPSRPHTPLPVPVPVTSESLASPITPKHVPAPLPIPTQAVSLPAASPTTSHASGLDQSRASSRLGTALTGETSPGASVRGIGSDAEALKNLPSDPVTWTVDKVVEWGRVKGFDGLTLGKFSGPSPRSIFLSFSSKLIEPFMNYQNTRYPEMSCSRWMLPC